MSLCRVDCDPVVCVCVTREDRDARFLSSRMAIVAAFRSWSGESLSLCHSLQLSIQFGSAGSLCIVGHDLKRTFSICLMPTALNGSTLKYPSEENAE